MACLNRLEQRPRPALHIYIILGQTSCEAGEGTRDLGMVLVHQRNSAVNGRGYRKILIGNLPQQLDTGRSFGIAFTETRYLAETIEHKPHPFASATLNKGFRFMCSAQ